jgi:hypothetical protein
MGMLIVANAVMSVAAISRRSGAGAIVTCEPPSGHGRVFARPE